MTALLKPVWIGRFHVTGPRDNPHLNGYAAAYLWVASQADDEAALTARVRSALAANGLKAGQGDRIAKIVDDSEEAFAVRKLIRDALRDSSSVACGKFQGFEDHAGRRPSMLEVKTERLRLRPWEPRDREPFAAMNADREVMAFQAKVLTRAESDTAVDGYLAGFHAAGFDYLVAELKTQQLKANASFVGMMGLRIMPDVLPKVPQPAVEIAFRVARGHQRQGYATEGGRALLKLAFHDFQLPEVVALTPIAHTAARRLLERLGMKHRADFEFSHPSYPLRHLYARHTLYQIRNPN